MAGAACGALACMGQNWQLVTELDLGNTPVGAHIALAAGEEFLAVGVSTATGGSVHVHARNAGGLDQWGELTAVTRPEPWFGWALAMKGDTLVVGGPGGGGDLSGAVSVMGIYPNDLVDPVQEIGEITLADGYAGDRFGFSLLWMGDTLAVGAVGRFSIRASGAVFLYNNVGASSNLIGQLSLDSSATRLPDLQWFGHSMAASGNSLVIAAPFSGFPGDSATRNIGSIHFYERDISAPTGFRIDTSWYDLTTDSLDPCTFDRIELGREGLAFAEGRLIVDHAQRYPGVAGTPIEPWQARVDTPACVPCELRIMEGSGPPWDLSALVQPDHAPGWQRSGTGWAVHADSLWVQWYDPAQQAWTTAVHSRNTGGQDLWGIAYNIPAIDGCDDFRGPLTFGGDRFFRTSLPHELGCGATPGNMRVRVQVFSQ